MLGVSAPTLDAFVVARSRLDPGGYALRAFLELPEWSSGFQIIHQKLGGLEGGLAMAGRGSCEDDALFRGQPAYAMHNAHSQKRPTFLGFNDMGGNLALGEAWIMIERHGH